MRSHGVPTILVIPTIIVVGLMIGVMVPLRPFYYGFYETDACTPETELK